MTVLRTERSVLRGWTAADRAPFAALNADPLGFTHDARDDFEHPGQPPGHPLRRHVLYRAP